MQKFKIYNKLQNLRWELHNEVLSIFKGMFITPDTKEMVRQRLQEHLKSIKCDYHGDFGVNVGIDYNNNTLNVDVYYQPPIEKFFLNYIVTVADLGLSADSLEPDKWYKL